MPPVLLLVILFRLSENIAKIKKIIVNTPKKTKNIGEMPVTTFNNGIDDAKIKDTIVEIAIPTEAIIYSKIASLLFFEDIQIPKMPERLEKKIKIIKKYRDNIGVLIKLELSFTLDICKVI